jgi:hypothetical protein
MPSVSFTPNLSRHLDCRSVKVSPGTVAEALEAVFEQNPRLRSYIVDDQGRLRQNVIVFVGGDLIDDRIRLTDRVSANQDIFVLSVHPECILDSTSQRCLPHHRFRC